MAVQAPMDALRLQLLELVINQKASAVAEFLFAQVKGWPKSHAERVT